MDAIREKPDALLASVWDDIKTLKENLENGGSLDMSSLNRKVKIFCEELQTLPASEAKSYQNKLSEVTGYLSEIVAKMVERKDAIKEEIDYLNQRKRATNAYGNSSMLNRKE